MSDLINIDFDAAKDFIKSASLGISIPIQEGLQFLTNNMQFPQQGVEFGKITLRSQTGKDISFGSGDKAVNFSGNAGGEAFAGIGYYPLSQAAIKALDLADPIDDALDLAIDDNEGLLMMRWGYDVNASGKGAGMWGAPLKAKVGFEGQRHREFAILQRIKKSAKSKDALDGLINNWMLPMQVKNPKNFKPGTWLVTEVESEVQAQLGAQFGYDFNWVKEIKAGGLSGDIGLRLQLGVQVALGFHLGGKFALVVGRPTAANKLQFRLYKQKTHGWNFAISAAADASLSEDFLTTKFDDFVKAVFEIHGMQILKDLESIKQWTGLDHDIPNLLSGLGVDYLNDFLQKTTGLDPAVEFEKAKKLVLQFLDKWNQLDHHLATKIWKLVEKREELDQVRNFIHSVADSSIEDLKDLLRDKISDVTFGNSTEGQIIISIEPEMTLFDLLNDNKLIKKVQERAEKLKTVLDGSKLEKVLVNLQSELNDRFQLETITDIITESDFESVDNWLKSKISNFLDDKIDFEKVQKVQKTIHILLAKKEEFYQKAVKALNSNYAFGLNASYQKSTSKDALIDMELDFDVADHSGVMKKIMRGNFAEVMTTAIPGIKLNQATLTHGIRQESHIEIDLPFSGLISLSHFNKSMAKARVEDQDGERLVIYELDAEDTIIRNARRASTLTIGGFYTSSKNQVRVHSTNALKFSYAYRQAKTEMSGADLKYQLKPYFDHYLSDLFSGNAAGMDTWISGLDKAMDQVKSTATDNFGHTLINLQVSLPAKVSSGWLAVPQNTDHPAHMQMSKRIQILLRDFIPFYFFADPQNFKSEEAKSIALLAYEAIPTLVSFKFKGKKLVETRKKAYWRLTEKRIGLLLAMPTTRARFRALLKETHERLKNTPGFNRVASTYHPDNCNKILADLIDSLSNPVENRPASLYLRILLTFEKSVVMGASKAAGKLAKFKASQDDPEKALKALSEFGSTVSKVFNKSQIAKEYGRDWSSSLSPLMFAEAAKAFDPSIQDVNPKAMLDLIFLLDSSRKGRKAFITSGVIPGDSDNIVLQERLISNL